jgi:hypothetical protein
LTRRLLAFYSIDAQAQRQERVPGEQPAMGISTLRNFRMVISLLHESGVRPNDYRDCLNAVSGIHFATQALNITTSINADGRRHNKSTFPYGVTSSCAIISVDDMRQLVPMRI